MKLTSFVTHSLLIAPYYSPSAVYCSTYKKMDSKLTPKRWYPAIQLQTSSPRRPK